MQQLISDDIFADALEKFEESRFAATLENEFRVRPYHEKNRVRYWISVVAGYTFNVLSLATGGGLVFYFLEAFMPYQLAAILTGLLLFLLEAIKRESIAAAAKEYLQFGKRPLTTWMLVAALSTVSVIGSFHGARKIIHEHTPTAAAVAVDTLPHIAALTSSIDEKNKQIQEARATRYKGTTTNTSTKTIQDLTRQLEPLEAELLLARRSALQEQSDTKTASAVAVAMSAEQFAYFSLVCEALFLLCVWYGVHYRLTSYKEMTAIRQQILVDVEPVATSKGTTAASSSTSKSTTTTTASSSTLNDTTVGKLKNERTKFRRQLSSYRHRLENNKGNEDTNKRRITELKADIERLTNDIAEQEKTLSK